MRPLELPISAATSRTVVAARPLRRATARAASMIASRRRSADMRAIAGTLAHIAQASNSATMPGTRACTGVTHGHGRGRGDLDDPDDAVPRAHQRPQRDGTLGALVEQPR